MRPRNRHPLRTRRKEVHLDAPFRGIISGQMAEGGKIEIGIQFTIHASQHVEIKGSRNAQGIVIGRQKLRNRLFQICAQEQGISGNQSLAHLGKKKLRGAPFEIADRAAQEENQQLLPGFACRSHRQ